MESKVFLPNGSPIKQQHVESIVDAKGKTLIRVRRPYSCHFRPQCLVLIVLIFVVSLMIVGLIVGLGSRKPRTQSSIKKQDEEFIHKGVNVLPPKGKYRLPDSVLPVQYNVHLHPDFELFEFKGSMNLIFNVTQHTDKLILHAVLSQITNVQLETYPAGQMVQILDKDINNKLSFYTVHIGGQGLIKGQQYRFSCSFWNSLENNFVGIYYDTYEDSNGTKKYFLASQLESIFARRVFPCLDEPRFKAIFNLSITHSINHVAIANMPNETIEVNKTSNLQTTYFQKSVPMPTYLIAMAVGEFKYKNVENDLGIKQRIWMRSADHLNRTAYVEHLIKTQLHFFQGYFNYSYGLPKLDHIGIPAKGKGAMENWGLITYGEGYLVTEQNSPPQDKIDAAGVIAHELSHQWFGNLVTMEWWDDLWLNEGFARCMEYVGVNAVEPTWNYWDLFIFQTFNPAIALDSLKSSRAIRVATETPADISGNFDVITYLKGGSIVRMLMGFIGRDTFRSGISKYMHKFAYQNTINNDLWTILAQEAKRSGQDLDIKSIMDSWTLQKNYPLVTVNRNYGENRLTLVQSRFLLDYQYENAAATESENNIDSKWNIPFTFTDELSRKYINPQLYWMHKENVTINNLEFDDTSWMIGNINATGFYRVQYDERNWKMLIQQLSLNHTVFTPTSRAQLVDDALNLARAGLLNQNLALNTTLYLSQEHHLVPWMSLEVLWDLLYKILAGTDAFQAYKDYMLSLLAPVYEHLGWEETGDDIEKLFRSKILSLSCQFDYAPCTDHAVELFHNWINFPARSIPATLLKVVLCTGLQKANGSLEWNIVWERMQATSDPTIRDTYRDSLACIRQEGLLKKYLDLSLDRTVIYPMEVTWIVIAISKNPVGKKVAWNFIQDNWANTGSSSLYGKTFLAEKALDAFYTSTDVEQLEDFRETNSNSHIHARRYVDSAVERAHANFGWINRTYIDMFRWFRLNARRRM